MSKDTEFVSVKLDPQSKIRIQELRKRYESVTGLPVKRHFILKQLIENGFDKMDQKLDRMANS
jgi:hypothetical protein